MALNVKNPQSVFEMYGKYGCLYMSYAHQCGIDALDALSLYNNMINRDLIDKEFFCKDGNKIVMLFCALNDLPIKRVLFVEEDDIKPDVEYITKYYNEETKLSHFVVTLGRDKVLFDSFGESNTVKNGVPIQWRTLV